MVKQSILEAKDDA